MISRSIVTGKKHLSVFNLSTAFFMRNKPTWDVPVRGHPYEKNMQISNWGRKKYKLFENAVYEEFSLTWSINEHVLQPK